MDSDFDWFDFNWSRMKRTPSLFHNLPCHTIRLSPCHQAHLVPVEIFSEIFLYRVQDDPGSQTDLMLVCRYWHDIMLSTPGVHSQMRIYGWTKKEDVERFGRRWLLDVTVDMDVGEWKFNPVEFHACIMAAAGAASRWRSLALLSLPPPGEYKDLQIMHPLQHLESFKLATSCELGNFLQPLITAITTTVTPRFTVMEVLNPDAALYIVQPAHLRIFSSLTALRLACRRMHNPVDILPSLHKLEILDAHHLSLIIHPPAVDLPLTQTLRDLRLKCVSIQWMAGRIFPALEECSIIFPQYADIFQSVYMPSCSILEYDSNNLGALEHFHCPRLGELEIKCAQCRKWRGDLQLAALHPIFAAQSLTRLQLEIKCSGRLLKYVLGLAPALEELWMGLSSPHALSSAFFLAFAAGGCNTTVGPLCKQLRELHLHYKRWSRGAERNGLIPAFGAIMASYAPEKHVFSFQLSFGEGSELQKWIVHKPNKRFDVDLGIGRTFIGVSSPHGIVPLSRDSGVSGDTPFTGLDYPPLPRESEYIATSDYLTLPIEYFFSFHSLKEAMMYQLTLDMQSNTQSSPDTPIFHTLKVLVVWRSQSSPLASQNFHRLERYQENYARDIDKPRRGRLTEMPLCTRLVTSLSRLATLKLPQVCELEVFVRDEEDPDYLWEKHVAVNARLSGLKLLFLSQKWDVKSSFNDIPRILGPLRALETLVLNNVHLVRPYVTFFEAFLPMDAQGTSGLISEGQTPKALCPKLESLQIEGISPTVQPELMPALKNIIILRATIGSPLRSFTFYDYSSYPSRKWELIGRDGRFVMEEVIPAEGFQLDI